MGRGDKRTRKGKIFAGSFGKTRPQGKKKTASVKKEEANKSEE
jgi:30S ribosomal protein S31